MLKKGDQTKVAILETAKTLFAKKGYAAVTMQDFCDHLGLSRGGLYRYFSSTKEIFLAMLDTDKEDTSTELAQAISSGVSAKQMMLHLLNTRAKEVQQGSGGLAIAVYEFCSNEAGYKSYMEDRFASAVEMLETVIRYGQSRQEFSACDPQETATHIVIFLEGLRLSSGVVELSAHLVEKQLHRIYEMVVTHG